MRQLLKSAMSRVGFDVVRVPHPHTLAKHLQGLLVTHAIDCVLDVGAMHGKYAEMLRSVGYRGWIVSFEPAPGNLRVLEQRAAGDRNWRVVPYALGEASTKAVFHLSDRSDFNSFLPLNAFGQSIEGGTDVRDAVVPVRRLDEVFDEVTEGIGPRRTLLKVDTQGFDVRVFRGARGCWGRLQAVQLELALKPIYQGMASLPEALGELTAAGFEVTGLFPVSADPTGALIEVDCVAQRCV